MTCFVYGGELELKKQLTLYYIISTFNDFEKKSPIEYIVEKGKNADPFSTMFFFPDKDNLHHFSRIEIVICKCFQIGTWLKFCCLVKG